MKAIVVTNTGGPDVLKLQEVKLPNVGPRDVLIRVHAASVNFADIKARQGEYHGISRSTFTPGLDCAGVIEAAGSEVTAFRKGQRVVAFPPEGSYAEYATAPEALTFPIPDELDFETAAASLTVGVTAYNVLKKVARIESKESVLIHAAAGGIGTTAVQLAALLGAKTIFGTVGSDEKAAIAKKLGAHHTINYRKTNFVEQVKEQTDGKGVDVILETIAGENFQKSMECLSPFGRIVVFGHTTKGSIPGQILTNALHSSCRSVLGYSTGTYRKHRPEFLQDSARIIMELLVKGDLHTVITERMPLSEASQAHSLIESRNSTGKIVLLP